MHPAALPNEREPVRHDAEPAAAAASHGDRSDGWQPCPDHRFRGRALLIKRLIDVIGAVGIAFVVLPIMIVATFAIRLSGRGPVIFRQIRVGRHGAPYTMYKLRTMHRDAEQQLLDDPDLSARYLAGGYKLACEDDPRVTRLGVLLRKSSIDELPQLLNVVMGQMSLVGPRPVLPEELPEYGEYVEAYLMARPGLTGIWQVAGRDAVKFPGRAKLDAAYIDGWSLRRDLGILLRTVPAAASARGVE